MTGNPLPRAISLWGGVTINPSALPIRKVDSVGWAFVVEELDVLADFHAALSCAFAHGDFTERPDRGCRHGLAAQVVECRQPFLTEENQCAAVNAGGDVDKIRTRHVGMNGRGAALVNVHLAREERLRRGRGAEYADVDSHAPFAEVTGFVRQDDR